MASSSKLSVSQIAALIPDSAVDFIRVRAKEELARFLHLKLLRDDSDARKLSPSPAVDELWQSFILHTKGYNDFQQRAGLEVHHRPEGRLEEAQEGRYMSTLRHYENVFGEPGSLVFWPPATLDYSCEPWAASAPSSAASASPRASSSDRKRVKGAARRSRRRRSVSPVARDSDPAGSDSSDDSSALRRASRTKSSSRRASKRRRVGKREESPPSSGRRFLVSWTVADSPLVHQGTARLSDTVLSAFGKHRPDMPPSWRLAGSYTFRLSWGVSIFPNRLVKATDTFGSLLESKPGTMEWPAPWRLMVCAQDQPALVLPEKFRVEVHSLQGTVRLFDLLPTSTVADLKGLYQDATHCDIALRMIFAGRAMEDSRKVASYGVVGGDILHVVLELRGC